ncbi:Phosphotransferase enzyme family protein [Loktanella fryxellensis]|uniref:Phosphotransferase enzyme family protein n=1 Tax=Loktanella fryxellensis TaxID=245187 RepID=A0A1H7ZKB7_9RHOB|nr:phosphotransferase [Loktanella fryxellensis]SEM58830.1 Phosphotransferase enzyme family protein [Loktanella fryxellensis]
MLSPSDAAVVARDPALPGLATLLDPAALAALTGRDDLVVTYLRYKPGNSCMVGLAPMGAGLDAVAAIAVPAPRWPQLRARPKWQGGPDPIAFHDDVHIAVVPLRHIRHVKGHKALTDPVRRSALLDALGLADAPMQVLRFKPERRIVVQVATLDGAPGLLKCHGATGFDRALRGARHAAAYAGAPLLAVDTRRHAILSGWIDGVPLHPSLGDAAFRATGTALARLHDVPAVDLRRMDRADERREVDAAVRAIAQLAPDLAARARQLGRRIVAELSRVPVEPCTLHGDFSADQVILQDDRPVILDWDRIAVGDAGRDLGGFLARLDMDVLNGLLDRDSADAAADGLLAGYTVHGIRPATVTAQRARALLALATEGFRQRAPDWPARMATVLSQALEIMGDDPLAATPGLTVALDPNAMRAPLDAAFGGLGGSDLTATLLRHKPGRRALIRYATVGAAPRVRLAKLRAKGPDHRTPALHDALRAAGLDGRGPHHVGVPQAFGGLVQPAIWLQAQVDGVTLTDALLQGADPAAARRAGATLALLHVATVPTDRIWTMSDEMAVLDKALTEAAQILPADAKAIAQVGRMAHRFADALVPGLVTGLHRDFHPDQVLLGDPVTWLLDLDLYTRGDPAVDLGNMLAHLTELGLRTTGDADRFTDHADALITGYGGADRAGGAARIGALHAISLARHIFISRRFDDRHHTTGPLIAVCGCLLHR